MLQSLTLNERLYIKSRVRKSLDNSIKKKIAQRIIENKFQEKNLNNTLLSYPKEDREGIFEIFKSHYDVISFAIKDINKKLSEGYYVKSKAEVNRILRENHVINRKGKLNEGWGEFALDMLFGLGPMIANSGVVLALSGGSSAAVGSGIAIAGMIYYGYKFSKSVIENNAFEIIINGMSFVFCAEDVFPAVGTAVSAAGKAIGKLFKTIFESLISLVKVPVSALFKTLANGTKAFAPAIEKSLSQAGSSATKHAGMFENLSKILTKGSNLMNKVINFFTELLAKAKDFPIIGKITNFISSALESIKTYGNFILDKSKSIANGIKASNAAGLNSVETGAVILYKAEPIRPAPLEIVKHMGQNNETLLKILSDGTEVYLENGAIKQANKIIDVTGTASNFSKAEIINKGKSTAALGIARQFNNDDKDEYYEDDEYNAKIDSALNELKLLLKNKSLSFLY